MPPTSPARFRRFPSKAAASTSSAARPARSSCHKTSGKLLRAHEGLGLIAVQVLPFVVANAHGGDHISCSASTRLAGDRSVTRGVAQLQQLGLEIWVVGCTHLAG